MDQQDVDGGVWMECVRMRHKTKRFKWILISIDAL